MSLLALVAVLALDAGAPDGGLVHGPAKAAAVQAKPGSPEDQEVIENLELLQHLDESADLDLMQELSIER